MSSRFIRSFDTSPGRDQCPQCERKHQKEHCVMQSGKGRKEVLQQTTEISSGRDLWRPHLTTATVGQGTHPTVLIDGPGFTLSFQNHRCPHSVVAFCFSL